jgi:hypothetical protein
VNKILKCNHLWTDLAKPKAIEDHSNGKVGDFPWNGVGLKYEESTWNEGVGKAGDFPQDGVRLDYKEWTWDEVIKPLNCNVVSLEPASSCTGFQNVSSF